MKKFNYVIATVLLFSLFSCEKESVVNDLKTEQLPTDPTVSDSDFAYNINDIDEVVRLANANFKGSDNSGNRTGDPYFEIDYSGKYFECGDGGSPLNDAYCLPPESACAIIICQDKNINSVGNTTEYVDADIIKMYPDNPVRVSYNKITAIMGGTSDYPNAYSSFVFE